MSKLDEAHHLEQIRQAISFLDLKGTNETVTKAMTIVALAEDFVRQGKPLEASLLFRCANMHQ